MRKLLFIFSLVLASGALADADRFLVESADAGTVSYATNPTLVFGQDATTSVLHTCSSNACTRTAPSDSSNPQEGLRLGAIASYRVDVCVSTGTLSGTGTLEAWIYDPDGVVKKWKPMKEKDLTVNATTQCQAFPVETNSMRGNGIRLVYRANAVAVSTSAPTLTVTIRGCLKNGTGCGQ